MKLKNLLVLFSLCAMGAMAEQVPDLLVVWAKDGSRPSFVLKEKPNLTFTATDLVIKTRDLEVTYALSQLQRFTYEKNDITGVTDLTTGKEAFRLQGNALYFPHLAAHSSVEIFKVDGTRIVSRRTGEAGAYSLPLDGFGTATYIVRVNGITYKMMKR